MKEVVIVPTYMREELLFCCLKRLRGYDGDIPIHVFPDRGTFHNPAVRSICETFEAHAHLVPDSDYYGNTANVMNAYLWAYNEGYDRVYYVESDVMVHSDFFSWHRQQQDMFPDIFASMAWIFNRHAPIADDVLFQAWYYSIGTCFSRDKLRLIVEHATPRYYADMQGYIESTFKKSSLNTPFGIEHYEQDGLIQRVLDADRTQTVSAGIAKCSHMGFGGYNRGWTAYQNLFEDCKTFAERVKRVEEFISDPYARAECFGREIVEREIGHELPKRNLKYRIRLPGGWESEFTSELKREMLPKRINSVRVPLNAEIVLLS